MWGDVIRPEGSQLGPGDSLWPLALVSWQPRPHGHESTLGISLATSKPDAADMGCDADLLMPQVLEINFPLLRGRALAAHGPSEASSLLKALQCGLGGSDELPRGQIGLCPRPPGRPGRIPISDSEKPQIYFLSTTSMACKNELLIVTHSCQLCPHTARTEAWTWPVEKVV